MNLEEFKKVINDKQRKEANCMWMTFYFFDTLIKENILETRMNSLIENLKEQQAKGWKRRTDEAGPKKLKDFHDDFNRKQQQKRQGGGRRNYEGGGGYRGDRDRRGGGGNYDDGGYYKKKNYGGRGDRDYDNNRGYNRNDRNNDRNNDRTTNWTNTKRRTTRTRSKPKYLITH